MLLSAAFIVARPIICDLSCVDRDPLATSIFKSEKILGISYEFEGGSIDSQDEIVLSNGLGKTELVKRSTDGKSGYVSFGNHGFPCGKARLRFYTQDHEMRRARVIVWVTGQRVEIESI
uniref:hypothetical protein n=1 Tax=Synechococcus sp. UW106 TaxID=368495 RepID=UPI000E0FF921|nr:hypothetical protein [Synechococcus sp. UW106]